jgi:hypothetical protein
MKKLLFILVIASVFSANTYGQRGHGGGIYYRPQSTVIVGGFGYSPFYSPFGYYGYPYYGPPAIAARPSKLDQEIADINHDYSEKIESVRMDSNLSGKERRHEIRELKSARDNEIENAKSSYYKS